MRAAGASRSRGSIACVTARAPNTFVSKTARISSSATTLARPRLRHLRQRSARFSRMRDGRVVHQHVEAAELLPDALGRRGDRGLVGDIELEGAGRRADAGGGRLPLREVARPDEHGEAVAGEILGDLEADAFVGSGDQGDGFVLHGDVLSILSTPRCRTIFREAERPSV